MGVINQKLTAVFHFLGLSVAKHPNYFICTTFILCLALGTGLIRIEVDKDIYTLYVDRNAESKQEQAIGQALFPGNDSSQFTASRKMEMGRFARLIITANDDGTLLRSTIWNEILEIDRIIHNATMTRRGQKFNYESLCARWKNDCYENKFLYFLAEILPEIENGSKQVSYPALLNPSNGEVFILPLNFGGFELNNKSDTVIGVKAVMLNYFLAVDSVEQDLRGDTWENLIMKQWADSKPRLPLIDVSVSTFTSLFQEQEANIEAVVPIFAVTVVLMCIFIVLSAMSRDWVKAKPWVALSGIFSAFLGTLAACGLLCYIGVPWIGINIAVPFIMLGIGIDDTFVMLAAWRQTNPLDSVSTRLANCYAEAAVSITITTLTDMLSFYVGLLTPIPSVQLFCAYAGTSILGIYICQVCCFGAFLAISGKQEAENRHSVVCCIKATPKSKSGEKSKCYKMFCVGGVDKADSSNILDDPDNAVMVFFRDTFSKLLFKTWFKAVILLLFVAYLAGSIWGILRLEEGIKMERLVREDSYLAEYYSKEMKYFSKYPHRIQVFISTPLDYSKNETQAKVLDALQKLCTSSKYMTQEFSENWLTAFISVEQNFNELPKSNFINKLNKFLINSTFAEDVKFNENYTEIVATRYIIQSQNVTGNLESNELLRNLRQVANSITDFKVTVFHPAFIIMDQGLVIQDLTIKLLSIAAGIVMLVALAFIPNFVCALCVFFTIVSIELGILGFMSLWSVNLDMISILTLVMCIGFSVDFSAHVSYSYISNTGSSEERIQKTMFALGLPIIQGAASTVIGVIALIAVPSYIFQTFFKIIVLVMTIATWHGLILLPVLLLIMKPELGFRCRNGNPSVKQRVHTQEI